jgi:hypothetical protein
MTIASKSNMYTASLLFRSLRDGVFLPTNLWEESLILIRAASKEEAEEKACQIGQSRKISYKTDDGVELTWEFFKTERVFEVDGPLESGVEVFSRHLRNAEVQSLLTQFDE